MKSQSFCVIPLHNGDTVPEQPPLSRPTDQNDMIEVREAEPYSYCQFVMGKDHTAFGRARHPWLTGSGGWNYTAVTKWILGVRLTFYGMIIDPCVPGDWKHF